jgi:hypothetical protein
VTVELGKASLLIAFVVGALACTVGANVGDLDALPSEDGGSTNASEAGTNDAAGQADVSTADVPEAIDAGCGVDFAQQANFVDVGVVQGPTPDLFGGAIAPGIYELTAMRVYFGPSTGTMQVRETIRVRGSATAGAFDVLTEARAATGTFQSYALHGETITWQVGAGPVMFLASECPTVRPEQGGRFDVKGDTLTLFDDMEAIERVYRRIP